MPGRFIVDSLFISKISHNKKPKLFFYIIFFYYSTISSRSERLNLDLINSCFNIYCTGFIGHIPFAGFIICKSQRNQAIFKSGYALDSTGYNPSCF
jgi:hypothetical protein